MDRTENKNSHDRRFSFTWPVIIGLALLFAGVSESLRNLRRVVEGEDALVSLVFCLVSAAAGVWILRRFKRPGDDRKQTNG